MAITATFAADFSDFQAAVAKAEVSLKSFETGAGKVEKSLNRVVNSLSGTKLIQDAQIAAEAVERIGGVSKLTEAELSKLSAQAKEAAEKLRAMGQEVPAGIQKIADATKGATDQTKSWTTALSSAAGAFGLAFSVGSVVAFGKSVFDTAGQIQDLSEQMGISTDAVQGFKFAAEQSGSSIDAVGTAITKMNANLSEGDKSTVAALKSVGLSFNDIRGMNSEDAFLAITDAIKQIPDPMQQTEVALKLFGKSAAQLLPAIKEGFRGVSESASKMSADTIRELEEAGDAWQKLANQVTIQSGKLIAATIEVTRETTKSTRSFVLFVDDLIKLGAGAAVANAQLRDEATRGANTAKDVYLGAGKAVRGTKDDLDAAAAAAKRWADQLQASFRKWSGAEIAEQAKILDITFRRMADSGQITAEQVKAMAAEAAKLAEQGAILSPRLWDIVLATNQLDPALTVGVSKMSDFGTSVELVIPKLSAFNAAIVDLDAKTKTGFDGLGSIGFKVSDGFAEAAKQTVKTTNEVAQLAQAFGQLAQISGGTLGGIVKDLGTIVASADLAKKSFDSIGAGKKSGGLSGILEMTTGVMGLASAAIAAGKAIASLFNRDKGRDVVEDFAKSFGGFDALQRKMMAELGPEWEKYWKLITQGVGKNNPEQAKRAIDEVTEAFERQKSKAAEAADAATKDAEAQVKAQQSALDAITARYAETISKLDSEYQRLNDSVSQEAEEAVMGVQETRDRARMEQIAAEKAAQEAMRDAEIAAKKLTFESWVKDGQVTRDELGAIFGKPLEIPYTFVPTNSPDGGGRTYTPPAGGGGRAAATFTVPVYLDNREVGRGMARVMPGVLTSDGR